MLMLESQLPGLLTPLPAVLLCPPRPPPLALALALLLPVETPLTGPLTLAVAGVSLLSSSEEDPSVSSSASVPLVVVVSEVSPPGLCQAL